MGAVLKSCGVAVVALAIVALALVRPASAGPHPADAGHGLSVLLPAGARLTHRHFTPCADPTERFSVVDGRAILTIEERLEPEAGPRRNGPFHVSGRPKPVECCAIEGRTGWVIHFRDHGRSFYAYLYPAGGSPAPLLRMLNSLRVAPA